MTHTKTFVNGIEFELDMYNGIMNFEFIEDINIKFEDPVAFENNDGLQKLNGDLYRFRSDNQFNCVFRNNKNDELSLTIFEVEMDLNEL